MSESLGDRIGRINAQLNEDRERTERARNNKIAEQQRAKQEELARNQAELRRQAAEARSAQEAKRIVPNNTRALSSFVHTRVREVVDYLHKADVPRNVFYKNESDLLQPIISQPERKNWRGKVVQQAIDATDTWAVRHNEKVRNLAGRGSFLHFWAGKACGHTVTGSPAVVRTRTEPSTGTWFDIGEIDYGQTVTETVGGYSFRNFGIALAADCSIWRWATGDWHYNLIHNKVEEVSRLDDTALGDPMTTFNAKGEGEDARTWWDTKIDELAARAVALAHDRNAEANIPEMDASGVNSAIGDKLRRPSAHYLPSGYVELMRGAGLPVPGENGFLGPVGPTDTRLKLF